MVRLLGEHQLTSPELTGSWERRLRLIEQGEDTRPAFMKDIAAFTTETVQELDKLKGVKIERAKLGPCPVCGREITENRKGYSCWSREDPGCGFVIWKKKAGKNLPVAVAQGADREPARPRASAARTRAWAGPRSRSRASAAAPGAPSAPSSGSSRSEEGKWRVEFDEEWAKEPPKGEAEEERAEAEAAAGKEGNGATPPAEIAPAATAAARQAPEQVARDRADQTAGAGSATPSSTFSIRGGPVSPSLISVPGQ